MFSGSFCAIMRDSPFYASTPKDLMFAAQIERSAETCI